MMPQYMPEILPIPIPYEAGDAFIHTDEHPFCPDDPTCPCHEDEENLRKVASLVEDGVLTPAEASRYAQGLQV